jgi:hypothetical protein
MSVETDPSILASILERAALSGGAGGVRPVVPPVLPAGGRAPVGENPALGRRGGSARAHDPGRLPRWRESLARALAQYEQKQAEAAPERAYIAAGRKARQVSYGSAPPAVQQSAPQETAATNAMFPNRRAALAYERVSGALLPVPLALGRGISLAV